MTSDECLCVLLKVERSGLLCHACIGYNIWYILFLMLRHVNSDRMDVFRTPAVSVRRIRSSAYSLRSLSAVYFDDQNKTTNLIPKRTGKPKTLNPWFVCTGGTQRTVFLPSLFHCKTVCCRAVEGVFVSFVRRKCRVMACMSTPKLLLNTGLDIFIWLLFWTVLITEVFQQGESHGVICGEGNVGNLSLSILSCTSSCVLSAARAARLLNNEPAEATSFLLSHHQHQSRWGANVGGLTKYKIQM